MAEARYQQQSSGQRKRACRVCGQEKTLDEFAPITPLSRAKRHVCMQCRKDASREQYIRTRKGVHHPVSVAAKMCARCGATKPAGEFYADSSVSDGLRAHCILCCREMARSKSAEERELRREKYRAKRELVIQHYGGQCACCGERRYEFLAIDHPHGGGSAHRRAVGFNLHKWLLSKRLPEGFRVLCHNCNMAMGLYGACPHQRGAGLGGG